MRHITQQENTFLLSTAHTAMLLQITKYGHVELLHYGMPVSIEDAAALAGPPYYALWQPGDVYRRRPHLLPR